jgi:hypothetical protein
VARRLSQPTVGSAVLTPTDESVLRLCKAAPHYRVSSPDGASRAVERGCKPLSPAATGESQNVRYTV